MQKASWDSINYAKLSVQRSQSAATRNLETKREDFARPLHWGCQAD